MKRRLRSSRRCSSLSQERRTGSAGSEKVQEVAEFVSKIAGRRRREIDYELFTETLGILVQDAYQTEAFQNYCLNIFSGLGWRISRGYFSRLLSYDEIQDLNTELIACGFASKFRSHKRKSRNKCRSRGRNSRNDSSPCRFQKIQDHFSSKQWEDEESSEEDVKKCEEKFNANDDRIPKAKRDYSTNSKLYLDDSEEDVKENINYFNVKMYDDTLGFGIGQHRWGGVEVTWVKSNCEAWSCGIRRGDVLVAVNHEDIRFVESLNYVSELLEEARPLSLRVKWERSTSP